jgi:hypothetical protein
MRDEPLAVAAAFESELAELLAPPGRCPEPRRDYLSVAAWVFAVLFGPALITLTVLVVGGMT